ncbi:MAG: hypothetical protein AB8B93_05880 [Pseudomonadales bacterium]
MSFITVDDLESDQALDAAAMRAVFGGQAGLAEHGGKLSLRLAMQPRFEESSLVPGLVKTDDWRQLPEPG